jgi:2-polyprenyl-6-methoxyphenol hydroxylase-like FAD-dependent oxidoreductase
MVMSAHDPLRHVFRAGGAFDAFMRSIPRTGVLIDAAEPTDDPVPFGGIENRRRKLVDAKGKPIVAGFVLAGDSAMHTNPTMGRGTSLGFLQAQWLAGNVGHAFTDPLTFTAACANWQEREVAYWFDSQAAADAEHCDRLRALAHGEPLPPLSMDGRVALAFQLLAPSNHVVGQAFARVFHMLARPAEALGNAAVARCVQDFLAANPDLTERREGTPRTRALSLQVDNVGD